jgi:hypothetical protein
MIIEMELSNPLYDTAADAHFRCVNSYRLCPFYTADGMVAAMWEELFTRVAEDDQRHFGYPGLQPNRSRVLAHRQQPLRLHPKQGIVGGCHDLAAAVQPTAAA